MEHDVAKLLADADWIGSLARELIVDRHDAEDLSQEARLAALRRPPEEQARLREWFAAVLRNLKRAQTRARNRRIARETLVARRERTDSHVEVLERFEIQRAVASAVAALDEPYRSTILLRYFDGLAPRAIAQRTSTPVRTVHTRLARGLERLRDALDKNNDGRREHWLSALVPLAHGTGSKSSALWMITLSSHTKIALAALAAGLLGWLFFADPSFTSPTPPALNAIEGARIVRAENESDERSSTQTDATDESTRSVVSPPLAFAVSPAMLPSPAQLAPYHGRVFLDDGTPLAGVLVQLFAADVEPRDSSTTDARGWFELEGPVGNCRIECRDDRYTTVVAPVVYSYVEGRRTDIVVSRRIRVAGHVFDGTHTGSQGVQVEWRAPSDLRARIDGSFEHSSDVAHASTTDYDGQFAFDALPAIEGAEIHLSFNAEAVLTAPAPQRDEPHLEFVWPDNGSSPSMLRGTVVDAAGRPAPRAFVSLGQRCVETDAMGRFALPDQPDALTLRAAAKGLLAAEWTRASTAESWPRPLELTLGGPALEITGRVIDAQGQALEGCTVELAEGTFLGVRHLRVSGQNFTYELPVTTESAAQGLDDFAARTPQPHGPGTFVLGGLQQRSYRLHVLHGASMLSFVTDPILAGSRDVEVRAPQRAPSERISGRVVTREGAPIAGATVSVTRRELRARADKFDLLVVGGPIASTDEDGRFEVDAPGGATDISVSIGDDPHAHGQFELAGLDLERLELTISRRCAVQLNGWPANASGDRKSADHVHFLDETGSQLVIVIRRGNRAVAAFEAELSDGRSELLGVEEHARTLVFTRDEIEVARIPIALDPRRLTLLP